MARDTDGTSDAAMRPIAEALSGEPDALRLAHLLHAHTTPDPAIPADKIAADIRATLALLADKPTGRHKLCIRPAAGGATIVEILNDDMPFLVDSVLGEIQARGLNVRHVSHPILRTSRTPQGRLRALLGLADQTNTLGALVSVL